MNYDNDALDEARAERSCSMGVGCGTAGVCYAKAHGRPEECSGFYVTADSTTIRPVTLRAILSDDFDLLDGSDA